MSRDTKDWVNSFEKCEKKKPNQKHKHPLQTRKPSHPFWHVALDIMGLLLESEGFKFILLTKGQFSKWHVAIPLQNQEAKTVAKATDDNWVSRFGCSANLHSHKGSNFKSHFFKNLCSLLGIDRTSATSYHPQKNAMIERTNRTIEETLSKYVGENHSEWAKYLQRVMFGSRSSIHAVKNTVRFI